MAGSSLLFFRPLLQNFRKVQSLRVALAFSGISCSEPVSSCISNAACAPLNCVRRFSNLQRGIATPRNSTVLQTPVRWKSKKGKRKIEEELEEEEEDDEDEDKEDVAHGDNEVSPNVSSMRIDSILKGGINLSRTKAAEALYSGNIRVNGSKPNKKSMQVDVGDEIDYIVGFMSENPDMMQVHRVTVLKIFTDRLTDSGKFKVLLRRQRNLVIEKYEDYEER
ncbi:mitochondrial transcription rescue factor 1-like [Ornithodoros turicata]